MNRQTGKPHPAAASLWPAKRVVSAALLLSVLSVSTGVGAQTQPPSDDELHSMYCVEVIRAKIELQRHLISASDAAAASAITPALRQQWIDTSAELLQGLANLEVVRYRLQAYMLPRIPALDAFALAAAMRQGEADFQGSKTVADQSACERPTWLPAAITTDPGSNQDKSARLQ